MSIRAAGVALYAGQLKVHDLCITVRHGGVRDDRLVAGEIVKRIREVSVYSQIISFDLFQSQENRFK